MNQQKDPRIELRERGYSDAQIKSVLKPEQFQSVKTTGLRFTIPLYNFEYSLLGYVLTLFENYERGRLPFRGSVAEQPAQIMDIFSLLATLKAEQQQRIEKQNTPRPVRKQR